MKLSLQDKRVALQGLTIPDGKVVDVNQFKQVARKKKDDIFLTYFLYRPSFIN